MATFVPIRHIVFLFLILFGFPGVLIQVFLFTLPLHRQIMTELALPPLLAIALLEEHTQHRLRIHAKRHFLHLNGLE